MIIHIHAPRGYVFRAVGRCPSCRGRRRMVITRYVSCDPDVVCCACGCTVVGGEIRRKSKRQRVAAAIEARRLWRDAPPCVEALRAYRAAVEGRG